VLEMHVEMHTDLHMYLLCFLFDQTWKGSRTIKFCTMDVAGG